MVILLNFLPVVIVAIWSMFLYWQLLRNKEEETYPRAKRLLLNIIGCTILLLVYKAIQPSYLPKGEIQRSSVPAFELSEAEKQNRMPKTDTNKLQLDSQQLHNDFMQHTHTKE